MSHEKLWHSVWPPWAPKELTVTPQPLYRPIDDLASAWPTHDAIIDENGRRLDYGSLSLESSRVAAGFLHRGVRKGDKIALLMGNRSEYIIILLGALKAGASVALIDSTTIDEDLGFQLELTRPTQVVAEAGIYIREAKVFQRLGITPVVIGDSSREGYEQLASTGEAVPLFPAIDPKEEVALIMHYAGVAERTMEVHHTHYGLLAACSSIAAFLGIDEAFRSLVAIPLSHAFGLLTSLTPLLRGGALVLMRRWEPDGFLQLVRNYRVNFASGPPMIFAELFKKQVKKEDVATLELCLTGGAYVPPELQRYFYEELNLPLIQGYGLTEAPVVTLQPPHIRRYGTVGVPTIGTDVKIVHPESGGEQPLGAVGELLVDAPWKMKGYSDPEETRRAFRNGWLRTGDLLMMDEQGFLYFKGVTKRIIKYKAYPVFPRDLESILKTRDGVADALVVGVADPEVGQKPHAYVVLKDEYRGRLSSEELLNYVNQRVAFYKKIRSIEVVETLPSKSRL